MDKILITPRSFGKTDKSVFDLLKNEGYELVINPYGQILTKEQMIEEVQDVVGIILGVDPLDSEVLKNAMKLRAVSKYGVGTDNIDKDYCKANNIKVSITAGANANAVADYTFALLMAIARKITLINHMCHQKDWSKIIAADIYGKKIGVLGLGAIGKGVAKRAAGFDMKVFAYDKFWDEEYAKANGITYALPDQIFKECDFITLHLPLTDETKEIINEKTLSMMKDTCILINTARGGLIDENALISALKNNKIMGAGLDVFNEEPPTNNEFYELDNLIMGSHCAASTIGASETMSLMAAQNILHDLKE